MIYMEWKLNGFRKAWVGSARNKNHCQWRKTTQTTLEEARINSANKRHTLKRVNAKMILSMTNDAQRVDCKKRNVKTK